MGTVAVGIDTELGGRYTIGDAVLHCPQDRRSIPCGIIHIGEGIIRDHRSFERRKTRGQPLCNPHSIHLRNGFLPYFQRYFDAALGLGGKEIILLQGVIWHFWK